MKEVIKLNSFFEKHTRLLKSILMTLLVTLLLCSFILVLNTAPVWGTILADIGMSLMPFLIAFILAYVIHPLISKIEACRLPRVLSVFLFYFIIFGGLYGLISWFLPTLIKQLMSLIHNLPDYAIQIQDQLTMLDIRFNLNITETFQLQYEQILSQIGTSVHQLANVLFGMIGSIVSSFVGIIIVPIALFYFLKDYEQILTACVNVMPKKYRPHLISIAHLLDSSLGAYIRGLFVIMILLSIISTLLLMVIDIKYPLLFGVLIGVTDFIPFVGPFIGAIPVLLLALSVSWKQVVAVLMVIVAIQFIEGNILQPFVMGRNIDMHPITIMVIMLLAGSLFGFYGLLFAIPVCLIIKTIYYYVSTLQKEKKEEKQNHFPY